MWSLEKADMQACEGEGECMRVRAGTLVVDHMGGWEGVASSWCC
jgi:hypothetical protein